MSNCWYRWKNLLAFKAYPKLVWPPCISKARKRLGHFTYIIFGLEVSEENWGSRARSSGATVAHFLLLTMHSISKPWRPLNITICRDIIIFLVQNTVHTGLLHSSNPNTTYQDKLEILPREWELMSPNFESVEKFPWFWDPQTPFHIEILLQECHSAVDGHAQ